jgi:hypothetical protein
MALCLGLFFGLSALAHEVVLSDQKGIPLLKVQFNPEWTALASRDGIELSSPDNRNRLYCLEFSSYANLEEGVVFLQTLRDTLFQSYENVSDEVIEFEGMPARLVRGKGVSRGFDTALEALIFRSPKGNICLVMLQQDLGYESNLGPLRDLVRLP